jgi:multidrug transporter EmrE-like cation transporter
MIFGIISVLLNACAQLAIKKATQQDTSTLSDLLKNPFLYLTAFLYATSIYAWFIALSRLNLTVAYPLQALGYVVVTIAAVNFLNEEMTIINWIGITVIIIGVVLTQLGR